MSGLFDGAAAYNQNISAQNVAEVTNMGGLFYGVSAFNKDIYAWNVANDLRVERGECLNQ